MSGIGVKSTAQKTWQPASELTSVPLRLKSYREIFRSSAIIGSASIANILIGIVRMKVLAVLLGPAGVGIMGLYQSIMNAASTFAGCGMETSGVRQVASSKADETTLSLIRRTLLWGNLWLGGVGMGLLWLAREPVSVLILGDPTYANQVGWLGVGVLLTLMAASRMAILQGLRRIGDVARVQVFGALTGSLVGVASIWWLGQSGLHFFVISAPAGSFVFSYLYARRIPRIESDQSIADLFKQWRAMLTLGIPIMAAALLTLVTQLIVRSIVIKKLGVDASGYFQAAWLISMTYIGFVLGAMAADYLPRLTETINDHERTRILVNEQTEMALLMAAPALLAMMITAPLIIEVLYSKSFTPAVEVLRWQVIGDAFKIIGWPMGFIVLAMGRGDIFIATQLNWNALFLVSVWLGIEDFGLVILGIGFLFAYVIQVIVVRMVAGKIIRFRSEARNLVHFFLLVASICSILVISYQDSRFIYLVGIVMVLPFVVHSVWRLRNVLLRP